MSISPARLSAHKEASGKCFLKETKARLYPHRTQLKKISKGKKGPRKYLMIISESKKRRFNEIFSDHQSNVKKKKKNCKRKQKQLSRDYIGCHVSVSHVLCDSIYMKCPQQTDEEGQTGRPA